MASRKGPRPGNRHLRQTLEPEYWAWVRMKRRCYQPRYKGYKNYGGRGIRVCDEWREDYFAFLSHVGRKPSPKHSLDRINNDGHYEPGNVRWATWDVQSNNRRNVRRITHNGRTLNLTQWADELGVTARKLRSDLKTTSIADVVKSYSRSTL